MDEVTQIFGENVFNETVMKARLPKETFKQLMKTIEGGEKLDASVATVVANAMKDWAVEKGATHYTHWFQPLTGFRVNLMLQASQVEVFVQHSKHAVTQHGTQQATHLLKTEHFVFQLHSVHTLEKLLIKRLHSSALCRQSANRLFAF